MEKLGRTQGLVELQNPRSVTAQEGHCPEPGQRGQPWVTLKELQGMVLLAVVCDLLMSPQEAKHSQKQ